MRSKLLNAVLLALAVILEAAILLVVPNPWMRLGLGVWALALIVLMASHLEAPRVFGGLPTISRRRFLLLRANVRALLDEVRRLNWLVVDLDRGFRDPGMVESDIELSMMS